MYKCTALFRCHTMVHDNQVLLMTLFLRWATCEWLRRDLYFYYKMESIGTSRLPHSSAFSNYLCIADGSFSFFTLTRRPNFAALANGHSIAIGSSKHTLRSFYTEIDYDLFILYILYILTFIIIITSLFVFLCAFSAVQNTIPEVVNW